MACAMQYTGGCYDLHTIIQFFTVPPSPQVGSLFITFWTRTPEPRKLMCTRANNLDSNWVWHDLQLIFSRHPILTMLAKIVFCIIDCDVSYQANFVKTVQLISVYDRPIKVLQSSEKAWAPDKCYIWIPLLFFIWF